MCATNEDFQSKQHHKQPSSHQSEQFTPDEDTLFAQLRLRSYQDDRLQAWLNCKATDDDHMPLSFLDRPRPETTNVIPLTREALHQHLRNIQQLDRAGITPERAKAEVVDSKHNERKADRKMDLLASPASKYLAELTNAAIQKFLEVSCCRPITAIAGTSTGMAIEEETRSAAEVPIVVDRAECSTVHLGTTTSATQKSSGGSSAGSDVLGYRLTRQGPRKIVVEVEPASGASTDFERTRARSAPPHCAFDEATQ